MDIDQQEIDREAGHPRPRSADRREREPDPRDIEGRLERIESILDSLRRERVSRDFYSTSEVADLLSRAEFTVREWCRLGRVKAQKKRSGRGLSAEWVVSHGELLRIQREGLLPVRTHDSIAEADWDGMRWR